MDGNGFRTGSSTSYSWSSWHSWHFREDTMWIRVFVGRGGQFTAAHFTEIYTVTKVTTLHVCTVWTGACCQLCLWIVKFLLSLNTKAEQRKGTKTWKTNVRIVIYWESVSNTHWRPGWLAYVWWSAIYCLSSQSSSGLLIPQLMLHISVLIQMLLLPPSQGWHMAQIIPCLMTKMCCHLLRP